MSETLLQGGFVGPCCYYKVALNPEGDELCTYILFSELVFGS